MNAVTATVDLSDINDALARIPTLPIEEAIALAKRIPVLTLEVVSETDSEIRVRAVYAE